MQVGRQRVPPSVYRAFAVVLAVAIGPACGGGGPNGNGAGGSAGKGLDAAPAAHGGAGPGSGGSGGGSSGSGGADSGSGGQVGVDVGAGSGGRGPVDAASDASGGAPLDVALDGPTDAPLGSDGSAILDGGVPPDGRTEAGSADGGASRDGGPGSVCDEFVMPADCTVSTVTNLPTELRCTGLYEDFSGRTFRCGVKPYAPAYALWADGASKQRYVWLPPGGVVDASDPDNFVYPVGTRVWKEFYVGPAGSQKLGETRLIQKAKDGWRYTTYVWSSDGATAMQTNDGVQNLFGTGHTVPMQSQCQTCHQGRPDFVLGWDFIMLGAGATGVTARTLTASGQLVGHDPALLDLKVPGEAVDQAALTYLHANCGVSCHNGTDAAPGKRSALLTRLEIGKLDTVMATGAAVTGINQPPSPDAYYGALSTPASGDFYDIRPQDPERSFLLARMGDRGSAAAMPPIATHDLDPQGMDAVTAWINGMTVARGYPAPAP
jgi:hypothetical protein